MNSSNDKLLSRISRRTLFQPGGVAAFGALTLAVAVMTLPVTLHGAPDGAVSEDAGPSTANWNPRFDPRVRQDPFMRSGATFAHLPDGGIVRFSANRTSVSHDAGKSWSEPLPVRVGEGHSVGAPKMSVTAEGTFVLAYMNMAENVWEWDSKAKEMSAQSRLPVYALRSSDGGKTWSDPVRIFGGRAGALTDIITTRQNTVVLPITGYRREPSRAVQFVMVTADDGSTWTQRIIDIGGHGHHDGAMEPTMVELNDGRLWMLIRTTHDWFYERFSSDGGLTWTEPVQTEISSSSSPGMLRRLASGRLVLVWNRVRPEGMSEPEWSTQPLARRGGGFAIRPSSWHREEVSLAFCSDDGRTWSKPVVIARQKNGWLSYPRLFEPAPGEIKLSLGYNMEIVAGPKAEPRGALYLALREEDFVKPSDTSENAQTVEVPAITNAHPRLLLNRVQLANMKKRALSGKEPFCRAWDLLKRRAEGSMAVKPAPYQGTDAVQAYRAASGQAEAARDLALVWHITGDDRYAEKALEFLWTWSGSDPHALSKVIPDAGSGMHLARSTMPLVWSYDLLHDHSAWTKEKRVRVESWLRLLEWHIKQGIRQWHENDYFNQQYRTEKVRAWGMRETSPRFSSWPTHAIQRMRRFGRSC